MSPVRLSLLALALAAASTAGADTFERQMVQVASGTCGANNPANDASLRRLVTGLKNSGTTTVSVVCTLMADHNNVEAPSLVYIYARNDKAVGGNISCTLTQGIPSSGQSATTRSVYVSAGGTQVLQWTQADYTGSSAMAEPNLQCSLPAGWSLQEVGYFYYETISNPPV
jgi:hypothetical protein